MQWLIDGPTLSGRHNASAVDLDVVAVIEDRARRHPDDLAVVHGEVATTYRQLVTRVAALRDRLVELEVPPGSAVVVRLPRGPGYVVSVLAALAHGCPFVPVAESEPADRVDRIVRRTRAAARVEVADGEVVVLAQRPPAGGEPLPAGPLAYILHTSGSTGVPKGAAVPRQALANLLSWYGDELGLTRASRFAQLARPSFDLSIPEVFLPLLHGGRMIVPPRAMTAGLVPVTEYLVEHGVTVLQLVPTVLRPFVDLLRAVPSLAARLGRVRTIVCNGESLPDRLRRDVARVLPWVTLVNSYGPTEACVAVTWHRCSPDQEARPDIIGGPAPNVDLYVVGADGGSAPVGEVGELCIGGPQVAHGYIGSPTETAQAFIVGRPRPGALPGWIYRTGDLVRRRPDGQLEYVGRGDRQVQVRGVRVELGEIEAAARATGACTDAHVVPVAGAGSGAASAERLCCFATPETADLGRLAVEIARRLPADRRPQRYHALAALPATANGKVDLRALTELAHRLDGGGPRGGRPPTQPGDALAALVDALAQVTGIVPSADQVVSGLDLDSLVHVELQVAAAERGFALPERDAVDPSSTVAGLAAALVPVDPAGDAGWTSAARVDVFRRELEVLLDDACASGARTLVLQCSLPDVRGVAVDDALAVLLAELDRRSADVTVALPAYTLSFAARGHIDLVRDRSESGMAATHVLRTIGGRRTQHPAYSFVAIGPRAAELAAPDWSRRSPFGDDSVFGWFAAAEARYVLLGTRALAHVHRCEHLAGVPYLRLRQVNGLLTDRQGTRPVRTPVYVRDIRGTRAAELLGVDTDTALTLGRGAVAVRSLAACEAVVVDVAAYEKQVVPRLRRSPYALLRAENRAAAAAWAQHDDETRTRRGAGHDR